MLNGRLSTLINVYQTFKNTGIHLLVETQQKYTFPMGATDDLGYFLYSSIFSYWVSLDPLVGASILFKVLKFSLLGLTGILFYFINTSFLSLIVIIGGLVRLNMPMQHLNHVYLVYFFASLIIPLILFAHKKRIVSWLLGICFFAGLVGSFSENIRSFASLPFVVFFLIYLIGSDIWSRKHKRYALAFFFIGWMIPLMHFNYEVQKRDNFLKEKNLILPYRKGHIFWHNIYTGFGFLNNQENIIWKDSSGYDAALKVKKDLVFGSSEYDKVIKSMIFKLFRDKRHFFLTVVFAKLGVVFYFFLIYFGWVGIICSYFFPKPWYIELSFFCALAISALPGLLTLPVVAYLMGFISCTLMYALYSLIIAFDKGFLKEYL